METQDFFEKKLNPFNWQLTFKVIAIGVIALALLIPKFMILGLIQEREKTADSARTEVMDKWSLEQTLRGPVLSVPFIERKTDINGNETGEEVHHCYILPDSLFIDGEIMPIELYRSIYQVVVYNSNIEISGKFSQPDFEKLQINPQDILWEKAELSVAVSDLRGIESVSDLSWNENLYTFSPGMNNKILGENGISTQLPESGSISFPANFHFDINLKGSDFMHFSPVGEITEVNLQSTWNDPAFEGNFLPLERNVETNGFTANWKVLNYNRNFPQRWIDNDYKVTESDFGVKLATVADHYQKNYRSAQYGILIILLVFLSFFLNEIITHQRVHPFQYILIGSSIIVFYLLLLSISEQVGFNIAYIISSIAVIGLVLTYSRSFIKTWKNSFLLSSILVFSFGFIYILMQLESLALLVGSIGIFCILSLLMYVTRNINWYEEN